MHVSFVHCGVADLFYTGANKSNLHKVQTMKVHLLFLLNCYLQLDRGRIDGRWVKDPTLNLIQRFVNLPSTIILFNSPIASAPNPLNKNQKRGTTLCQFFNTFSTNSPLFSMFPFVSQRLQSQFSVILSLSSRLMCPNDWVDGFSSTTPTMCLCHGLIPCFLLTHWLQFWCEIHVFECCL